MYCCLTTIVNELREPNYFARQTYHWDSLNAFVS